MLLQLDVKLSDTPFLNLLHGQSHSAYKSLPFLCVCILGDLDFLFHRSSLNGKKASKTYPEARTLLGRSGKARF